MSNPYELRLELFNSARDLLIQRFEAAERRYIASENKYNNAKERYYEIKEKSATAGEFPTDDLPEFPIFPSDEDITSLAYQMKRFISDQEGEGND